MEHGFFSQISIVWMCITVGHFLEKNIICFSLRNRGQSQGTSERSYAFLTCQKCVVSAVQCSAAGRPNSSEMRRQELRIFDMSKMRSVSCVVQCGPDWPGSRTCQKCVGRTARHLQTFVHLGLFPWTLGPVLLAVNYKHA